MSLLCQEWTIGFAYIMRSSEVLSGAMVEV
jgi:hypothetical protein